MLLYDPGAGIIEALYHGKQMSHDWHWLLKERIPPRLLLRRRSRERQREANVADRHCYNEIRY